MLTYLLRRVVNSVFTFLAVTALTFVLCTVRGPYAIAGGLLGPGTTQPQIEAKIAQLGLDRPLPLQYLEWLGSLARGDLGNSYVSGAAVTEILGIRVPISISLIAASLVLTLVVGVLLGVAAATRGGAIDRGVQVISVIAGAVPSYWLALILVIAFSLNLALFPATGFVPLSTSIQGWALSITLPAIAVSLGSIFGLAVWVRSSIIDVRRQDWVRTLRARGIAPRTIMFRHVLRSAAASTVQLLGLTIIGLVGGTIIVERIFALPGVGTVALTSGLASDVPVVLGAVVFMVAVIAVVNLLVDITIALLNPKTRTR